EFDLSLITSSKDKKNNIYLCIKGSFPKEENRDRIDFLVTPIRDGIDFLAPTLVLLTPLHEFSQRHLTEWNKK
ncbi:hypothetical protein, partial [Bacteroides thetaiotaomicron]